MILSPKQWTVASPLMLWKSRLCVRILIEREERIAVYFKDLMDRSNDHYNMECSESGEDLDRAGDLDLDLD